MGKGDKRTAKGKRIMGTYGNSRKRKASKPIEVNTKKNAKPAKAKAETKEAPVKKTAAAKKTATKKTTAKKTTTKKAPSKSTEEKEK